MGGGEQQTGQSEWVQDDQELAPAVSGSYEQDKLFRSLRPAILTAASVWGDRDYKQAKTASFSYH